MRQFFLQLAMHQTLHSQLELSHVTRHFATYKMLCCELQQSCELQESRTILFCNIARQVASCTCSTPLQLAMFFSCNHCVARKLLHITCIGFRNCSHLTVIVKGGQRLAMHLKLNSMFLSYFYIPSAQNIPPLTNAAKMIQEAEENGKSLLEVSSDISVSIGKTLRYPRQK